MWEFLIPLFAATVQSGTPILYATLGEMMTEKGGVLNLGVEGMMAVSALAAFWVSYWRAVSRAWSWPRSTPSSASPALATRWSQAWP
jgi:ABC-type uncharacterized transport system permease subunit